MAELQVLIVAYGKKGIESVASLPHPAIDGVEYIVSWQYADDEPVIPQQLLDRKDFKVMPTATRGVATNRNLALEAATAPLLLLSDDDVIYTRKYLLDAIQAFHSHPDADFISFRYYSEKHPVVFPDKELKINKSPYWITGFVMAFRREIIERTGVRFNPRFGIGAEFPAGEEDVFFSDLVKHGANAIYLPVNVAEHPGDTTFMRTGRMPDFIRTKGAVFLFVHPHTWPLRMLTHAWRFSRSPKEKFRYIAWWMSGVTGFLKKR